MIIRQIDDLGRVVIPVEIRKLLGIDEQNSEVSITVKDSTILIDKYINTQVCAICDGIKNVKKHNKTILCWDCREKLSRRNN